MGSIISTLACVLLVYNTIEPYARPLEWRATLTAKRQLLALWWGGPHIHDLCVKIVAYLLYFYIILHYFIYGYINVKTVIFTEREVLSSP